MDHLHVLTSNCGVTERERKYNFFKRVWKYTHLKFAVCQVLKISIDWSCMINDSVT